MLAFFISLIACGTSFTAGLKLSRGQWRAAWGWFAITTSVDAVSLLLVHRYLIAAIAVIATVIFLWLWRRGRGDKRRIARAVGDKTRLIKARMARAMTDRTIPVPTPAG